MVKDFGVVEKDIGYYVGFVASAFSLAQLLTSVPWGMVSDKIGRRPVLLIGLAGNTIGMLCFGVSKSLAFAVAARGFCGLVNGNIGVAKSVLGEITDADNRAVAFSLIGLNYGLGMMIGPTLGGLLSNPVEKYPAVFGGIEILKVYPYLLPCLCSALVSMFGFFVGYFYLPETAKSLNGEPNETQPLLEDNQTITEASSGVGKAALSAALAYSVLCFQEIIFVEVFPLWAVDGIQFNSTEIGIVLAMIGVISFACQIAIYPAVAKIATPFTLFWIPCLGMCLSAFGFPFISSYLSQGDARSYLWPVLIVIFTIRTVMDNFGFTSVMILISESARPGQLGLVNGIGQSLAALSRTIGPALAGSMWAWSNTNMEAPYDKAFVFLFIAAVNGILIIQAFTTLRNL
ncbi:major facilitator superfamily domain-containing protein [Gorgonomyces haynaldii]|nr:major facilitator superfamily domain-containing protein [Gorgonomyces haynaldii]